MGRTRKNKKSKATATANAVVVKSSKSSSSTCVKHTLRNGKEFTTVVVVENRNNNNNDDDDTNKKKKGKKKKKKGKKRPRAFCLPGLPTRHKFKVYDSTPWFDSSTSQVRERIRQQEEQSLQQHELLRHVSLESLQHLDEELWLFSTYVQLSPQECMTRNVFVRHLEDICRDVFVKRRHRQQQQQKQQQRRNQTHVDGGDDTKGIGSNDDVHLRPFGSYEESTRSSVCTHASDVDLALYGVVPTVVNTTTTTIAMRSTTGTSAATSGTTTDSTGTIANNDQQQQQPQQQQQQQYDDGDVETTRGIAKDDDDDGSNDDECPNPCNDVRNKQRRAARKVQKWKDALAQVDNVRDDVIVMEQETNTTTAAAAEVKPKQPLQTVKQQQQHDDNVVDESNVVVSNNNGGSDATAVSVCDDERKSMDVTTTTMTSTLKQKPPPQVSSSDCAKQTGLNHESSSSSSSSKPQMPSSVLLLRQDEQKPEAHSPDENDKDQEPQQQQRRDEHVGGGNDDPESVVKGSENADGDNDGHVVDKQVKQSSVNVNESLTEKPNAAGNFVELSSTDTTLIQQDDMTTTMTTMQQSSPPLGDEGGGGEDCFPSANDASNKSGSNDNAQQGTLAAQETNIVAALSTSEGLGTSSNREHDCRVETAAGGGGHDVAKAIAQQQHDAQDASTSQPMRDATLSTFQQQKSVGERDAGTDASLNLEELESNQQEIAYVRSDDNNSDADSADKLESFRDCPRSADEPNVNEASAIPLSHRQDRVDADGSEKDDRDSNASSSRDGNREKLDPPAVHPPCDDEPESDNLEVSFVSKEGAKRSAPVGPTGEIRKLVLGALKPLGKALWKSPVIHTVEVRKFARVPIIAMGTHLGFEADIAIGGNNGADTSQYASSQAKRFRSFSPVVRFLKVLLTQQDLDKPFTGGLGSYKLYVLVAHHLEKHIAMGGVDRPSEVLVTFFYRYRTFRGPKQGGANERSSSHETVLSQNTVVKCDGGSAELLPVFKLQHCCDLFDMGWSRLIEELELSRMTSSFLSSLVHSRVLRTEREQSQARSGEVGDYSQLQKTSGVKRWSTNKGGMPAKENDMTAQKGGGKKRPASSICGDRDATATELIAGYGMIRGPRGGLIPRNRPDVDASRSMPPEAIGRATKNRKNKKKQKRDEGLKHIAISQSS